MALYSDPRLLSLGVVHGTTDRACGDMRQTENNQALFNALHIPAHRILRFQQIHSDRVVTLSSWEQGAALPPTQADAWVLAGGQGWGAAIVTADCVPLILWDESARVLGLAHCGWRGVAAGLPGITARHMRAAGAEGPLSAWVGPHIQRCCFEVQDDVARQFPGCVEPRDGKLFVNLNRAIDQQLQAEEVDPARIQHPYYCTCGDAERFFSFRRDHTRQAMLTFVYRP